MGASPHKKAATVLDKSDPTTEFDRYLSEVAQLGLRMSVLDWWRNIGQHDYPHVALMARQFLAIPATSASVERLFSTCGRSYNSLSQSQKESTLESRMFVGINIQKVADMKFDSDSDSDDE